MEKLYKGYGEAGLLTKKIIPYNGQDLYHITIYVVVNGNHQYKKGEQTLYLYTYKSILNNFRREL